jgi:putative membrane protein
VSGDKRNLGGVSEDHAEAVHFVLIEDDSPEQIERESEKPARPLGIIIDTEDGTPITPTVEVDLGPPLTEAPSRPRKGVGIYATASLAVLATVYWAMTIAKWIADQFHRDSALGYAILPFVIAALLSSIWWIWTEISAWRRLVIADRLRAALSDSDRSQADRDRFLAALRHLEATVEGPRGAEIAAFLKAKVGNRDADELRVVFDHDVIYPMDEAAPTAVHRAVYDSFFVGLVSPTPITDTTVFVVRAIGMIRAVAVAYGHRPGKLGLYRLIRRILADVAILSGVMILMSRASSVVGHAIHGVSDVASTALTAVHPIAGAAVGVVGEITGDVADTVAKEIADAITAATRMAKLGLLAIAASRPIDLSSDRKAEISVHLKEMVFTLRRTAQRRRELAATAGAPSPSQRLG